MSENNVDDFSLNNIPSELLTGGASKIPKNTKTEIDKAYQENREQELNLESEKHNKKLEQLKIQNKEKIIDTGIGFAETQLEASSKSIQHNAIMTGQMREASKARRIETNEPTWDDWWNEFTIGATPNITNYISAIGNKYIDATLYERIPLYEALKHPAFQKMGGNYDGYWTREFMDGMQKKFDLQQKYAELEQYGFSTYGKEVRVVTDVLSDIGVLVTATAALGPVVGGVTAIQKFFPVLSKLQQLLGVASSAKTVENVAKVLSKISPIAKDVYAKTGGKKIIDFSTNLAAKASHFSKTTRVGKAGKKLIEYGIVGTAFEKGMKKITDERHKEYGLPQIENHLDKIYERYGIEKNNFAGISGEYLVTFTEQALMGGAFHGILAPFKASFNKLGLYSNKRGKWDVWGFDFKSRYEPSEFVGQLTYTEKMNLFKAYQKNDNKAIHNILQDTYDNNAQIKTLFKQTIAKDDFIDQMFNIKQIIPEIIDNDLSKQTVSELEKNIGLVNKSYEIGGNKQVLPTLKDINGKLEHVEYKIFDLKSANTDILFNKQKISSKFQENFLNDLDIIKNKLQFSPEIELTDQELNKLFFHQQKNGKIKLEQQKEVATLFTNKRIKEKYDEIMNLLNKDISNDLIWISENSGYDTNILQSNVLKHQIDKMQNARETYENTFGEMPSTLSEIYNKEISIIKKQKNIFDLENAINDAKKHKIPNTEIKELKIMKEKLVRELRDEKENAGILSEKLKKIEIESLEIEMKEQIQIQEQVQKGFEERINEMKTTEQGLLSAMEQYDNCILNSENIN